MISRLKNFFGKIEKKYFRVLFIALFVCLLSLLSIIFLKHEALSPEFEKLIDGVSFENPPEEGAIPGTLGLEWPNKNKVRSDGAKRNNNK